MNENKKYAPLALALSGLALLAALGLGFVQREWTLAVQISTGLVVIGFALFIYFDPDRARRLFSGRQARYGSNALVLFLAFLGILIVINYLVYDNADQLGWRWDLTEDKSRTLADETIETLESLPGVVQVKGFFTFRTASSQETAQELLEDYQFHAQGNLEYEFIDPEEDPFAAQEAGLEQGAADSVLVFTLGENTQKVTSFTESAFTNALIRLLNPEDKGAYFLVGHGERSLDTFGESSITSLKASLENKNYVVDTLSLLAGDVIPGDAQAIIIAGPLQPVTEEEMAIIADFVTAGGSLIVAIDPRINTEFGDLPDPVSEYLIDQWGVVLGENVVIDIGATRFFNSPLIGVSAAYAAHPISSDLNDRQLATVFPLARSVTADDTPEGVTATALIFTSDNSWGETDIASLEAGTPEADPAADMIGPITLAVAAENLNTGARIVVFGDSEFFADAFANQFGNGDLMPNAVDWAAGQENLITLTPRETTTRFLLPPQGYVINLLALGSIIVVPFGVLAAGVIVWIRRRRRA